MLEIVILLIAGIGAGIVTGLVGASAVIVAAPLLIVFLGYPAYMAIGIALSIDVFASSSAALVYYKNKRINLIPALILLFFILVAVIIGSYLSKDFSSNSLSIPAGIGIVLSGIFLIFRKRKEFSEKNKISIFEKHNFVSLVVIGLLIGTIAGVFGAGGGMMIFFALVFILNYKSHEAIGTSVFLMIFIALFGGFTHYIYMPFSEGALLIGGLGGIIGAVGASKVANKMNEQNLRKIVGVIIIIMGVLLSVNNFFPLNI